MRYFLTLSYNGSAYHGWQRQPRDLSVQEVVEHALSTRLREPISVTGAGRTDTGVHAAMMVAHFDAAEPLCLDETHKRALLHSLNGILPRDIAVSDIKAVHPQAHARFDAKWRTYKYFVHLGKSPFLESMSWQCPTATDFGVMNEAARRMMSYIDFTSFSKLHTDVKTNNCHITKAEWEPLDDEQATNPRWVFTITADRFLRNMVRAVVGTLMLVGTGKITVEQFCRIIEQKDRCLAGESMPAKALFLWKVEYPDVSECVPRR